MRVSIGQALPDPPLRQIHFLKVSQGQGAGRMDHGRRLRALVAHAAAFQARFFINDNVYLNVASFNMICCPKEATPADPILGSIEIPILISTC